MVTFNIEELSLRDRQNYLQSAIAPRPICFASTIDKDWNVNLSPFSFFNIFSTNPPTCIFSASTRVRDNTTKHTLQNVIEVPECVINIVTYDMVQQVSLASTEYPKGVNEFIKAGFTELKSVLVKPPRVAEAPVQFECVVKQVIPLGDKAGAGNLILAEVKIIHLNENILDKEGKIDQEKLNLAARLGGNWYCQVTKDNLFQVPKPNTKIGIGIDEIPQRIIKTGFFTKSELAMLANIENLPEENEIQEIVNMPEIKIIIDSFSSGSPEREKALFTEAKKVLESGDILKALKILMI